MLILNFDLQADGRPFSVFEDVHRAGFDIIWAVTFGDEIGTTTSQIQALDALCTPQSSESDQIDTPVVFLTGPTPVAFDTMVTLTRSVETALSSPFPRMHLTWALRLIPEFRYVSSMFRAGRQVP